MNIRLSVAHRVAHVALPGMGFSLIVLGMLIVVSVGQMPVFASAAQPGGTFVVDTTSDVPDADPGDGLCDDGNGNCSLRAALEEVAASPVVDTITFELNAAATISLTASLPAINGSDSALTIQGPGPDQLTIDGDNTHRPFFIGAESPGVTIAGLTIAHGFAEDAGGAIYNLGTLTLTQVVLRDNLALNTGGGIMNAYGQLDLNTVTVTRNSADTGAGIYSMDGSMTVTDSTISFNNSRSTPSFPRSPVGDGGGIYIGVGEGGISLLTVIRTTLHDNRATNNGGGIRIAGMRNEDHRTAGAHIELINSTVSGNRAARDGGGIAAQFGFISLASSTVVANVADNAGGGIANLSSLLESKNSIIAGNSNGDSLSPNCTRTSSATFAVDYTLIGDDSGCATSFDSGEGNLVGNANNPLDPNLGELADNGGATQTHALLSLGPGSPARDAGDPDGCTDTGPNTGDTTPQLLASDQRGAPRMRDGDGDNVARCDMGAYEAGLNNDSWPRALRLPLTGSDTTQAAMVSQIVEQQAQARWYKFTVEPGSTIQVQLSGLPANYDMTIYKDILLAHDALLMPSSNADLVELTAEFAPDAYSPDAYSPDAYSPDAYSPDAYSPDAYSPDAYSPDAYSPDAYSPDAYSPDAYSPDAYSPDAYSPDAYSPDAYSPDLAYSSAQVRSLIGVSAFDGVADEAIVVNTWGNSNDFYVRVRGRNGTFDPTTPFDLQVTQFVDTCGEIDPTLPASTLAAAAGNFHTLILTDPGRMNNADPLLPTMGSDLAAFAARPEINGVVIDVGADDAVISTNSQADDYTNCPVAKNLVAQAVKQIVDNYWALNPELEYIVIVGNDDVIPFFRHPDRALLANEMNYVPPVANTSISYANLILGYVLSQDAYGADVHLSVSNTTLPIPKLAVGRLVETADDVITMLAAYSATVTAGTPGVAPTPATALVTGYDFLEDAALAIESELAAGIGAQVDTLITPRDLSPLSDDPRVWTATQLGNSLLTDRHDLIFLAGHFSAASALAADYSTRLLSVDVAASPVDLQNALIFSAGCHSGYNVVNEHGIPNVTQELDWAQAFAQKGATLIAGTGYQYGDTDFLEYSERLYHDFSRQLLVGTGPVAIGDALVAAKQIYLAETAQLRGIHEKALLQATLYGLPMLQIDMPFGRTTPTDPGSIVATPRAVTQNPGLTLGLTVADVTIPFALTRNTVTLKSVTGSSTVDTTYFAGANGVVNNPAEPVQPLELRNVHVPGTVLRGIGFRGGSYTDLPNITPLTGAATTEIRGVHPPFLTDIFFPVLPWRINYFDLLSDPNNGITRLLLTPGQFVSDGSTGTTGILRQWDNMDFRLYYSSNTTTFAAGSTPALTAPPAITNVAARSSNGNVDFQITVLGDPAAGIQEAWVTYTICDARDCNGTWQTLDLSRNAVDSARWEGTLALGNTAPADIRYSVHAVNGVGLVATVTNLGEHFIPDVNPANPAVNSPFGRPPTATTLAFQAPPARGPYNTLASFTAELRSGDAPLADQPIKFALGSQQRTAVTDNSGQATVTLPLLAAPGDATVRATFAGATGLQAAEATSAFAVTRQSTQVTLSAAETVVAPEVDTGLRATLTDSQGRRLREKNVIFIVANEDDRYVLSTITNLVGDAPLGLVPLPAGDYSVMAYFSGSIPLAGESLVLDDLNYLPSAAMGTLRIVTTVTPEPTYQLWLPEIHK